MRNLLFLVIFFIFVYRISALGASTFYAEFTLTNREYGQGAQFPCRVWYDLGSRNMRIDYFQPDGTTRFMTVYYNYTSRDKYQICGSGASANCSRATWNTPQTPFQWTPPNLYTGPAAQCVTPDWNGPRACPTNCATYTASPAQPQGVTTLSYTDTSTNTLCLVRWTPGTGFTWGPEWHITRYVTAPAYPNGSPTDVANTYASVLSNVRCPEPTCFAELDIALSIDESGSIGDANWPTVQNFVKGLIGALDIKSNGIRVGLSYFSGTGWNQNRVCTQNFTNGRIVSCDGGCSVCGGLWNTLTPEVSTNKANLISLVNGHAHQKGFTCISCGMDQGIRILNAAPKANVQKLIILMTDGEQNMVTSRLSTMANLARNMKIDVIAVGVANYKLSDLQQIAPNDKIYTSPDFNGLAGLIQQIITPLCQPLPSIETCNFCSGLCSCQANCNCPTCNDFNMCTNENCDVRPAPQGTGGVCVSTNITCEDNNPCTQNLCTPSTGCNYTVPTVRPPNLPADRFCRVYRCQNPQGFVEVDIGNTQCPPLPDRCAIRYCDNNINNCTTINRNNTAFGVAITYTTSAGQTLSTTGCGRPANAFGCQQYTCNPNTGECREDNSGCACIRDSDCNDGNGCTTDTCVTTTTPGQPNVCRYVQRDCWSELSNGNCVSITQQSFTQTIVTANNATAESFYLNGPNGQPLNANGLPPAGSRSCADLACYRGQRSTYTCQSLSASTSQCVRTPSNCTSNGCVDNVCRPTGGWSVAGQVNTACDVQKTFVCNDTIACTRDDCVSTFTGTNCYSNNRCASTNGVTRCNFVPVNSNCNDNTVCTTEVCNAQAAANTTGCVYTNVTVLPQNFCFIRGCNPTTGPFSIVNTTACPQRANRCFVDYCDPTFNGGNGGCRFIDKTTLPTTSSQTYTDASGISVTVQGCQRGDNGCFSYGCNTTTGACFTNTSACACQNNTDCNDNNGCTIDVCLNPNTTFPTCQYTPVDCFSELSNGGCVRNTAFTASNATGLANYLASPPNQDNAFSRAIAPANYSCDQMGCFSGRRSVYTCASTNNGNGFTCSRTFTPCPVGGCSDTICRTLGTWTNGQIDTECGQQRNVAAECTAQANPCRTSVCNTASLVTDANRCIFTNTSALCDDGNQCTIDSCNTTTGCVYIDRTDQPPNNECFTWRCDRNAGWVRVDRPCPFINDCTVGYCNATANGGAGQCIYRRKTEFALGSTATFTDYAGNVVSIDGCGRPPSDLLLCREYQCVNATGQCQQNTTDCQCVTDSNCEDGNGCTIDRCVPATGRCSRENVDCWSRLSNGACVSNINSAANNPIFPAGGRPVITSVGPNIDIGLAQYYGNFSNLQINFNLDANGLPSPNTGVQRSCAHLACYNGNPSNYTCFSTQEGSFTCQRVNATCGRNGCQDNICRVLGGAWTNDFQLSTDCGTIFRPNCADKDSCTNDFCNSTWVPSDPPSLRCIRTNLNETGQCDDGNFCTFDYCDSNDTSSDPCKHNLYNDRYVRRNLCRNGTRCDRVQCTVNRCIYRSISCLPSNLCVFYKCNDSTNGTCASFPTGLYTFDKCGVCGGNGLSCIIITPANPNRTSIAVALGVGLGVGLCVAAAIIAFLSKKSYDMYNAIGLEQQGTVTNNPTHEGGGDFIDTSQYN